MIDSRCFRWATSVLLLTGARLFGQSAPANDVPLKNWATPLYWQPSQAERENASKSGAQIQFSANASSNTALIFVAVSPCRLVDTRGAAAGFIGSTPFDGPYVPAGGTATFPIQSTTEQQTTAPSPCGVIPSIAQAYSLNLTVLPHPLGTPVNYVTMWPTGVTKPQVSTLNDQQGAVAANAAIVPAGSPNGGINVFAYGPADVIIDMNGFYAAPSDLSDNTAIGTGALSNNTTGVDNTATGTNAMQSNTTGYHNTADGDQALLNNTTGYENTAIGVDALALNVSGADNTAIGFQALDHNNGNSNTASGYQALFFNTSGNYNTASGYQALYANTMGVTNTASGYQALYSNTTGAYNTASGYQALYSNTTGIQNTASGYQALDSNTTGGANTAFGLFALFGNTTGSNNLAIGQNAGAYAPPGSSYNIQIGSLGASTDNATIHIGDQGTQTSTFVAGISGVGVPSGVSVVVNSNGKLGIVASSRRFKEQITNMGDTSKKLLQLRPVNFFYKPEYDDGSHLLQYGLIAEEVEKVYPEMVAYDSNGQIMTVKYQMLAPMLLNEVQKQNAQLKNEQEVNQTQAQAIQLQQAENRKLEEQGRQQTGQIRALEERLAALEALTSSGTAAAKSGGGQ